MCSAQTQLGIVCGMDTKILSPLPLLRKSGATCFWLAPAVANVIMRHQRTLFLSRRPRLALGGRIGESSRETPWQRGELNGCLCPGEFLCFAKGGRLNFRPSFSETI
jgi:hypothetical protein